MLLLIPKEDGWMKGVTLEAIYKKVVHLERDVGKIKKSLMREPELRDDFILRMKDIDLEKSIMVEDFGKRYGLK
jgi:hypothetical protein